MAGSNDFTVHNPTNANQEPNGSFAGDSLTTGGIGVDAIMPSAWMNARWYEDSVGFYALAQALANKNYVVSKTDPAVLTAVMSNILTNNDVKPPLISVGYSPTPNFNAGLANGFDIVLAGNVTAPTLINYTIGQTLTFIITQGSTPFSFTPPSNINGWQPISQTPNSITIEQFIVKEDNTIWPLSTQLQRSAVINVGSASYFIWSDGLIEAWGNVTLPATHGALSSVSFSFPIPFTAIPNLQLTVVSRPRSGSGWIATVSASSMSTSFISLDGQCSVPEGGGGATFDQNVTVNWKATGV